MSVDEQLTLGEFDLDNEPETDDEDGDEVDFLEPTFDEVLEELVGVLISNGIIIDTTNT